MDIVHIPGDTQRCFLSSSNNNNNKENTHKLLIPSHPQERQRLLSILQSHPNGIRRRTLFTCPRRHFTSGLEAIPQRSSLNSLGFVIMEAKWNWAERQDRQGTAGGKNGIPGSTESLGSTPPSTGLEQELTTSHPADLEIFFFPGFATQNQNYFVSQIDLFWEVNKWGLTRGIYHHPHPLSHQSCLC